MEYKSFRFVSKNRSENQISKYKQKEIIMKKLNWGELISWTVVMLYLCVPIICWTLPFLLAYYLPLSWWQGGMVGYLGSTLISSTCFALCQLPMGGPNFRAIKLGLKWPLSTLIMTNPVALSISLGVA